MAPKGDASALAGLDLGLEWDAALARLEAVELTTATDEWLLASNIEAGRARISLAGLATIAPPATAIEVLNFHWHVIASAGQSPLSLQRMLAFDRQRQAIAHQVLNGGLIVSSVPVEQWTMGRLRSCFSAR